MILAETRAIQKSYGAVTANRDVSLRIASGEVHAVVGENGAGKTTLVHILAGVESADLGSVEVRGGGVSFATPSEAIRAGIVVSYQHAQYVPSLALWENIVLGFEPQTRFATIDKNRAIESIQSTGISLSHEVLQRRTSELSSGQIRLASLAAAILHLPSDRPGVLILDEPTTACSPPEVEMVFGAMRSVAAAGNGILFITHRLPEVMEVADRVTVLRQGATVFTAEAPFNLDAIADEIVGSADDGPHGLAMPGKELPPPATGAQGAPAATPAVPVRTDAASPTEAVPVAICLRSVSVGRGRTPALRSVSLEVRRGEIVGLTGIRESGIETMEDVLAGIRAPDAGSIHYGETDVTGRSPRRLREAGLRYVPTDRLMRGASLNSSVTDNLIVLERDQLHRAGIFVRDRIQEFSSELAGQFTIEGPLAGPLSRLSGGNIQKVILSRELMGSPKVMVVCEPSWGLDLRSREMIFGRLRLAVEDGAAVLLISTDVDEVLLLSDRVGVLYGGVLSGLRPVSELSRVEIGRLMVGADLRDVTHA